MSSGGVSPAGGGGAPTGAAGGDLGGTYPNPTVDLMAGGTITGSLTVANAGFPQVVTQDESGNFATLGNTVLRLHAGTGLDRFVADDTNMKFTYNSAPSSLFLSQGECALWLDATPAATKLMAKGVDSDGTVKTAVIAVLT